MKTNIKITGIITSSILALGLLTGCSSQSPANNENPNADLPSTEVVDPSLKTLNTLVKNKTTNIKVGEVIKLDVSEDKYTTLQVVSSSPEIVAYQQGNLITETNPMPSSPPSLVGLAIGEAEITVTDDSGEPLTFKVNVTQ